MQETEPVLRNIVKVGGSLSADPARLRAVLAGLAAGAEGPCIVVPGGGPFADAVRRAQAARGFDDARAHRLALDAMGRMAGVFGRIEPRLTVVQSLDALAGFPGVPVWDPAALKAGRPGIPEAWSVTSDSLALWLATHLHAPRCVLVKSRGRPAGASLADLARDGLVDAAFPGFAAAFPGEIVIRGPGSARARIAA